MAKRQHRETGNMPTQRALRAGVVGALVLLSTSALAEVCDKAVGERWMPQDGPVWLLNPVGLPIGLILLVGGLITCILSKRSGPCFLFAGIVALLFLPALLPESKDADFFYQMMLKEGCISPSTQKMNALVIAAFGITYAVLGLLFRRRRVKEA